MIESWMVQVLVVANVAVLTAFGSLILTAWRIAGDLRVVLYGRGADDPGFIQTTREAHQDLGEEQHEIRAQLRVQGRLLNEVAYTLAELADTLEEEIDASVPTDRVEDLQERVEDARFDDGDD